MILGGLGWLGSLALGVRMAVSLGWLLEDTWGVRSKSALVAESTEFARSWSWKMWVWKREPRRGVAPPPPMLAALSRRGRLSESALSARRREPSWRARPRSA